MKLICHSEQLWVSITQRLLSDHLGGRTNRMELITRRSDINNTNQQLDDDDDEKTSMHLFQPTHIIELMEEERSH